MNPKKRSQLKKILKGLSEDWFSITPFSYQEDLLADILDRTIRLLTIRATTGAGKSYITALAGLLFAIFYNNSSIGIIAPSEDKTKIIMTHIANLLASCPIMEQIVRIDTQGDTKLERLTKEVSKSRITFRNGSYIQILTADIPKKGQKLMGFGFSLVIIDEAGEIPESVNAKLFRMFSRTKGAKIIELGNPWGGNRFERHSLDPDWKSVKIDWEMCVDAGLMDKDDILKVKSEITDLEWKILYEAEFPEDIDFGIFSMKNHINKATRVKEIPKDYDKILVGLDVASGGIDFTVLTIITEKNGIFYFTDYRKFDERDTNKISNMVDKYLSDKYTKDKVRINVDAVGLGKGVCDNLKSYGWKSYPYIAGNKAFNKRFYNRKIADVFGMADIFYNDRFYNLPVNSQYVYELRKWKFELLRERQLHLIDPEDKSPDFSDSLLYALSRNEGKIQMIDINF